MLTVVNAGKFNFDYVLHNQCYGNPTISVTGAKYQVRSYRMRQICSLGSQCAAIECEFVRLVGSFVCATG